MFRKMIPALFLTVLSSIAMGENPATIPASRDGGNLERHDLINERVKATADSQLLFIGDSITQAWEGPGKAALEKHFAKYKPLNLGIGGDRTQHVLWRLENGNIEGLKPKVAVVMIGTNNTNSDSADQIAEGVTSIVSKLRAELPETKILLLAVFPRGEKPNPLREKIDGINKTIAKLDDGEHVHYLDVGPKFLQEDGSISKEDMPDYLHLTPKAYETWAEAIAPKVDQLMAAGN